MGTTASRQAHERGNLGYFRPVRLAFGDNVHLFMEQALDHAAKVLLILSPLYKEKATARTGGVGLEFSMITSELFESLARNKKFIQL